MILAIVEKMISIGGAKIIYKFYSFNSYKNFENLKKIHAMNKKLSSIIEHIFIQLSSVEVCKERFLSLS